MSQSTVPDILLTPYALYDIVAARRIDKFDLAIDILEELVIFGYTYHVSIPGGRKLLIAMKLKYVLEQIKRQADSVSMIVNKYFAPKHKHTQGNALYRDFLNSLIENKELQQRFFETDYTREFGSDFFDNIKRMTENLVLKIVPVSEIVKGMHTGTSCFLDRLNLLTTKKSQNIGDLQSALSLSFSYRNEVPVFLESHGCSPTQDCSVAERDHENLKKTNATTTCLQQCQNNGVSYNVLENNSFDLGSHVNRKCIGVALKEFDPKKDQMELDVGEKQNVDFPNEKFNSLVGKPVAEHVFRNDKEVADDEDKERLKESSAGQNFNRTVEVNTCLEIKDSKGNESDCILTDIDSYCYIKAGNDMGNHIKVSSDKIQASCVQEKTINEFNTSFDECNENSKLTSKPCKKRRIKCKKSLFELLFDDKQVKYLKLDQCKSTDKCTLRRKQLRSKTEKLSNVPSFDVRRFYTSFKKRDESLDAGTRDSAVKSKQIDHGLGRSHFHCLKRQKCTKRSCKIKIRKKGKKKHIQDRKRSKRVKKLYTCIKKTRSSNFTHLKNSVGTGSVNDDHSESLSGQNKHQAQTYTACKEDAYSEEMLSLKCLDLSPSDHYASQSDKTEDQDCLEKTNLVASKDHQDNYVQAFNNFAEKSTDVDCSRRNALKENDFDKDSMGKFQNIVLNNNREVLVHSSNDFTSVKEKEVENVCSDKESAVYLETTPVTMEELLTDESDLDTVLPPSVDASPEYPELDIFEEEASFLDNTVQYFPDFTRFLK